MKNKKLIVLIIFLIGIFVTVPSFATEMVETVDMSPKNYYKLREEFYKKPNREPAKFSVAVNNSISVVDYLATEAMVQKQNIDISQFNITTNEITRIVLSVFDKPEMYALGSTYKYYYRIDPNTNIKYVLSIEFTYIMTLNEYIEAETTINKAKNLYLSGIKPEWNDLEKIVYTNNFLCQYCTYASNIIESSHTLYGALVDRLPVCDGYSKAFKFLTEAAGIKSIVVTSFDMEHAWNMVEYNGDYYHLDVTWNDDHNGVGRTTYRYFLASDSGFSNSNRNHYSWMAENDQTANNTQFDGTNTPWGIDYYRSYLMYKDGYWYSLENIKNANYINICKQSLKNFNDKTIIKKDTLDYVFVDPSYTTDNDYIYYTTQNTITRMQFDGQVMQTIYTNPNKGSKIFYGVEYKDGKFYYDTLDLVNNTANTATRKTYLLNYILITSVVLENETIELNVDEEKTLVASILPENTSMDKKLTWTSSDTSVATVDQNGVVKGITAGNAVITVTTSNGKKDTCSVTVNAVEIPEEVVFTNLAIEEVDGKYVIKFPVKTTINSTLSISNFPVLGNGYTVEVYTSDDSFKSVLDYYGSKNIIKIKKDGNVEQEYIVIVNGDVNGDGNAMLYDAFQILKDTILPGKVLDDFDKLIRDSNNDGFIMLYDAFQFLKRSILGI